MKKLRTVFNQSSTSICCKHARQFQEACYISLQSKIYRIAYSYSKKDAKDLTHDIFLKIFELDINKLKPHADYIESYLIGIARYYCITYVKKKKILEDISECQLKDKRYQPNSSSKMDLENALKSIPQRQAIAVKMKSEGFTIKEIAESMNSSEGAVKNLIYYGKQNIRKYFQDK